MVKTRCCWCKDYAPVKLCKWVEPCDSEALEECTIIGAICEECEIVNWAWEIK